MMVVHNPWKGGVLNGQGIVLQTQRRLIFNSGTRTCFDYNLGQHKKYTTTTTTSSCSSRILSAGRISSVLARDNLKLSKFYKRERGGVVVPKWEGKKRINVSPYLLLFSASPLLFTASLEEEQNPKSELIFMCGKAMESLTHRLLENEYGQSIFLCCLFGCSFLFMYNNMKIRKFLFDIKYKYACNNIVVGHPMYMKQAIPPNPLIKRLDKT